MADTKPTPDSETVLVGCKLPHGIYLDLYDGMNLRARVKLPGIMTFKIPTDPPRKFQNPEVVLGHTMTAVPRKHWEEWLEKNKRHPSVVNGFVYAAKNETEAKAVAREHERETTGFEQVDPRALGVEKLSDDPRPKELR